MAKMTGKDLYISFQGTQVAGSGVEVYQEFTPELTVDLVDSSAGNGAAKTYLQSLKDGKATLKLVYQGKDGTSITSKLRRGQEGTLLWGEEGTAAGKPKGGVVAIVQSFKRPVKYNDLVTVEVSFQFNGDLLFDSEAATW